MDVMTGRVRIEDLSLSEQISIGRFSMGGNPITFTDPRNAAEAINQTWTVRFLHSGEEAINSNPLNFINPASKGFGLYMIGAAIAGTALELGPTAIVHGVRDANRTLDSSIENADNDFERGVLSTVGKAYLFTAKVASFSSLAPFEAATFAGPAKLCQAARNGLSKFGKSAKSAKTVNPAHNAADYERLKKSLASRSQLAEPGMVIAGGNSGVVFRDVNRIVKQYGGKPSEWVKKSSSNYYTRRGTVFETHWVKNIRTGQRVEFKTKFPNKLGP